MWKRTKQFPRPFQNGSLFMVIVGILATSGIIFFYLTNRQEKTAVYLFFIVVGVAGTLRNYFSYRKKKLQNDLDLIADRPRLDA